MLCLHCGKKKKKHHHTQTSSLLYIFLGPLDFNAYVFDVSEIKLDILLQVKCSKPAHYLTLCSFFPSTLFSPNAINYKLKQTFDMLLTSAKVHGEQA